MTTTGETTDTDPDQQMAETAAEVTRFVESRIDGGADPAHLVQSMLADAVALYMVHHGRARAVSLLTQMANAVRIGGEAQGNG